MPVRWGGPVAWCYGQPRRVFVTVRVDLADGPSYLHDSPATVTNFDTGAPLLYLDCMVRLREGDSMEVVRLHDPVLMAEHIRWTVHRAS